ncbi:LuxR C-terminal-related transcriptional regulator [Aureisphaera galaxeae]|uniref:LuxR C-terminal-related transcriptional regulator n=1 Tax=Aureisphaera galaxeae TaxID=1538023 RepID=UPI0023509BDA|nr:LuxR C-terminal-related transcriptional regulator [Aureisphaera galaxeae]MDC8006223.1 LuxR C-terminal-related transcriptional regulator [Aureisphaera galaxeae]
MQTLEKLLKIVDHARQQGAYLNLEETIIALSKIQHISTEKELIQKVIRIVSQNKIKHSKIETLSKRENEVFHWIGLGCSSREIGKIMGITESTVSTHRKKIIKKLGLSGPGQLQKTALRFTEKSIS